MAERLNVRPSPAETMMVSALIAALTTPLLPPQRPPPSYGRG